MIKTKITSSLENCFLDSRIEDYPALSHLSALRNERISFQLLICGDLDDCWVGRLHRLEFEGALAEYATVREVKSVPVSIPTVPGQTQENNYLRVTPGLYPDLLLPLRYDGQFCIARYSLTSLWVEIDLRKVKNAPVGENLLLLRVMQGENEVSREQIMLDIIDAMLPKQELLFTQWFYTDCLANYYGCPVWSEKHWEIIENFAVTAKENGINMLLTPVFTPSLDTRIGGERLTTQLVGVTKTQEGYDFDFSLLDRWVEMCDRVGIEYFEISHLFTQWGAAHAPKIMATVDGEYRKLFGWETDALSTEYTEFLRSFLTALLAHMKARGDDKRCYFHISDEPNENQLESYRAAKESVADLLEGYVIMDALSNYEYYSEGLVSTPIPCNSHIKPFLDNHVPGLWTYYCSSQWDKVSNRFLAMPSYRNRSIGMQMYKYDIVGFLHWGYNFYNTYLSMGTIDPYLDTCGDAWVPAGDTFSVYPGKDGQALESLRIVVFYEALQDMRAMKLAESLCGKDAVVEAIEAAFGGKIMFDKCAFSARQMLAVREAVNRLIEQN